MDADNPWTIWLVCLSVILGLFLVVAFTLVGWTLRTLGILIGSSVFGFFMGGLTAYGLLVLHCKIENADIGFVYVGFHLILLGALLGALVGGVIAFWILHH